MLKTKLGGISKAPVNPHLSASPKPPFMLISFFTTNFNRVSQRVQIRMSGDNVSWDNFMHDKNEAINYKSGKRFRQFSLLGEKIILILYDNSTEII